MQRVSAFGAMAVARRALSALIEVRDLIESVLSALMGSSASPGVRMADNSNPELTRPDEVERQFAGTLRGAAFIFEKEENGRFQGSILACRAVARFIYQRNGGAQLAAPFMQIAAAFEELERGGKPKLFSKKSAPDRERERSPERRQIHMLAAAALEVMVKLEPRGIKYLGCRDKQAGRRRSKSRAACKRVARHGGPAGDWPDHHRVAESPAQPEQKRQEAIRYRGSENIGRAQPAKDSGSAAPIQTAGIFQKLEIRPGIYLADRGMSLQWP